MKIKGYVIYSEDNYRELSSFLLQKDAGNFIPVLSISEYKLSLLNNNELFFDIKKYNTIYSKPITVYEIARTLSHIQCWKMIVDEQCISDDDFVLISESNITLVDDFYNMSIEYINKYRDFYDFITLSDTRLNNNMLQNENVSAVTYENINMYNDRGASLYLVKKKALIDIINRLSSEKPFWLYDDFYLSYNYKRICKGTNLLGYKIYNDGLENSIIVTLFGGLGNQMFQYAFARSMSLKNNKKVLLETINLPRLKNGHEELKLNVFNLNNNIIILDRENSYRFLENKHIYQENNISYHSECFEQDCNQLFSGLWQSERYFSDIRKILLQEFTLKFPIRKALNKWLENIQNTESVSLHIRRGDFLTSGNGILSIQYYIDSIKYLEDKLNKSLDIFVFSNDMDWVKNNLSYDSSLVKLHFFDQSENNYQEEELYLMSCCKHNIIANSTFSWWGAYLNNYSERIIIAPEFWFLNTSKYCTNDNNIIPDNWIKIKNTFM